MTRTDHDTGQAAAPASASASAPARTGRRWWGWALIGLGGFVAMILILVVTAVLAVIWIPAATHYAVRTGLGIWDDKMPGTVELQGMRGSLGAGLSLQRFELRDGEGRPLLVAEQLLVELDASRLFLVEVALERGQAGVVDIWVDHDWKALAPEGKRKREREGHGPNFPFGLRVQLDTDRGTIWLDGRELVVHEGLRSRGFAVDRTAEVEIELGPASLPQQDQQIESLVLAARWDDPVVSISTLDLELPEGSLQVPERAHFDVESKTGALALEILARPEILAQRLELELDRLGVEIDAPARATIEVEAGPEVIELSGRVDLAPTALLVTHARLQLGELTQHGELELGGHLAGGVLDPSVGPVRLDVDASLDRGPDGYAASAGVTVQELHGPRLTVDAGARADSLSPPRGTAWFRLHGLGITGEGELGTGERQLVDAETSLRIDELATPLGTLARALAIPELADVHGSLELDAGCASEPGGALETTRCEVRLGLERIAGFDARVERVRLDAEGRPLADPIDFDATLVIRDARRQDLVLDHARVAVAGTPERLRVDARGSGPQERFEVAAVIEPTGEVKQIELDTLELVSNRTEQPARIALAAPARISIAPERVGIHDLRLLAGGGRVAVDGHVGLAGTRSDLQFEITDVELARIDPLVPGPTMRGHVELRGGLDGPIARPAGWTQIDASGLAIGPMVIGALELDARLCERRGSPTPGPSARAVDRATWRETPYAAGPLAGEVVPITTARCSAPGELQVWLTNHGPLIAKLELAVSAVLSFDGGVRLRRGEQLAVRMRMRKLALVELGGLMPSTPVWWRQVPEDASAPEGDPRLIPEGELDLDLAVSGTGESPRAELLATARELVIDRTELGSVGLRAGLGESDVELELEVKPGVGTVELDAKLPIHLDLVRAELDWDRAAEHRIAVELRGLVLHELEHVLGPKIPALGDGLRAARVDALVSGSIEATGTLDDPLVSATLRAHGLRQRDEAIGDLRVVIGQGYGRTEVFIKLVGPLADQLDADFDLPVALIFDEGRPVALDIDPEGPIWAEIHARGVELAALEGLTGNLPISGRGRLDLRAIGSLTHPQIELEAQLEQLRMSADEIGDVLVRASLDSDAVGLEVDLVRRGEHLVATTVEVPVIIELGDLDNPRIAWDRHGHHHLSATGRNLDNELLAALTGRSVQLSVSETDDPLAADKLEASARFDLFGGGDIENFSIEGWIHGDLETGDQTSLALDAAIDLDQSRQQLSLELEPREGEGLTLAGELRADVPRLLDGRQKLGEIPFEVELDAPGFELHNLGPLIAAAIHNPQGTLHASVTGKGEVTAPQLEGEIEIRDGALTVLAMRQRIDDIDVIVDFANDDVELREFSLSSGAGGIEASGQAKVRPGEGVEAEVELAIDDVPIVRPGLPVMTFSGDVDVDLDLDPDKTRLKVALAKGKIEVARVKTRAPQRIPESDAIDFDGTPPPEVREQQQEQEQNRADEPPPSDEVVDVPELEMSFALTDPLLITGASIDMAWVGDVRVARRGQQLELDGELEAQRGRLELLGHRFELRRGIVTPTADGSLIPYVDIIAVTDTAEAEITVDIRGRATEPELHFSSSPAMSEYEILTLLVTGSSEIGEGDSEVEAEAASLLAAVSNPELQRQLNRYLGIDRAKVGFGESIDQPILSVGKRVTRDVYVETTYHHNAPEDENMAEVGVEYNFYKRWSLETYFGDAAVGGIGVFWTHSFGGVSGHDRNEDDEDDEDGEDGEDDGESADESGDQDD